MKRLACVLMLAAITILVSRISPALSAEPHEDGKLIGLWTMTRNATDKSGQPCPFVPQTMHFFRDQTVVMSSFGKGHLPYKTVLTKEERQAVEKRNPDLAGKGLIVVKPNPNMSWASSPMVYAYSMAKSELTLIFQGWSPATFAKKVP